MAIASHCVKLIKTTHFEFEHCYAVKPLRGRKRCANRTWLGKYYIY